MKTHAIELAQASPPITITTMTILGYPLSEWVYLATLLYTTLLIIKLIRGAIFSRRISDKDPACAADCPVARRNK